MHEFEQNTAKQDFLENFSTAVLMLFFGDCDHICDLPFLLDSPLHWGHMVYAEPVIFTVALAKVTFYKWEVGFKHYDFSIWLSVELHIGGSLKGHRATNNFLNFNIHLVFYVIYFLDALEMEIFQEYPSLVTQKAAWRSVRKVIILSLYNVCCLTHKYQQVIGKLPSPKLVECHFNLNLSARSKHLLPNCIYTEFVH